MKAPAYGLDDALVAPFRLLKEHVLNSEDPMKSADLRSEAPTSDPSLFFVFREGGSAAGSFTPSADDIPGRGESDILPEMRIFPEQRCGKWKLRESPLAHVGLELAQDNAPSASLTQGDFAKSLLPFPPPRNYVLLVSNCSPRKMFTCASASLVNIFGLQQARGRKYVPVWFVLPLVLICCKVAMCIALMT